MRTSNAFVKWSAVGVLSIAGSAALSALPTQAAHAQNCDYVDDVGDSASGAWGSASFDNYLCILDGQIEFGDPNSIYVPSATANTGDGWVLYGPGVGWTDTPEISDDAPNSPDQLSAVWVFPFFHHIYGWEYVYFCVYAIFLDGYYDMHSVESC